MLKFDFPLDQEPQRIDSVLATYQQIGSRTAAVKLIEAGQVTVDGVAARKSTKVLPGQTVEVQASAQPAAVAPDVPAVDFEIVYDDEYLLVVDKPAGLVVHPAPGHETGTLSQALAGIASGGSAARPGIVHRLDKETSGLLVVAKSDDVLRALQAALQGRTITREYLALVRGVPQSASGTVEAPVGRDRRDRKKISLQTDRARSAVTHFSVEQEFAGASLLRLRLETGRTHQIRVHLAAIGLPVCGDVQYGEPGSYGLERQFLHACRLMFEHPVTGEAIDIQSELPAELSAALKKAAAAGAS
ncbi:MAG: RluA family pseudouridine synthase [Thermoleophilaceae bacterium]|nr:RluA family pseudouridine synthase [Thermoleophilaceae bacterium]